MTRLQRILAGILFVQLVLAVIVFWPRSTASAESGPLFTDLDSEAIVRLSIVDNLDDSVELVQLNDDWVLADSGDYPADTTKIESVLEKIVNLQTGRLVTRSQASHKQLQVAENDFLRLIDMELSDGSVQTLLLGSAPNPQATHVRRIDEDETYIVSNLASWEVGAAAQNWIDTTYVSLNREDITRIVLENEHGVFQFDKQSDDTWTTVGLADGEALNMDKFNPILNQAVSLRMTKPLGLDEIAGYRLDAPLAKLSITSMNAEDGSTQNDVIRIGAQLDGETNYVVKWSGSSYYVSMSEFSVQSMIDLTQEDLIQPPAAPTPAG